MFPERGGELLDESAACQEECCPHGTPGGRDPQEDGRGVEGSEGTGTEGVLLMASSTSDFWWEVLKTPS